MQNTARLVVRQSQADWSAEPCCWPKCEAPIETSGSAVCDRHLVEAYRIVRDRMEAAEKVGSESQTMPARGRAKPIVQLGTPYAEREGVVYFILFRDRIKIGWSSQPLRRIGRLPHDEVLAVVPGTLVDEARCHRAFRAYRCDGEWFKDCEDIRSCAESLAAGMPIKDVA